MIVERPVNKIDFKVSDPADIHKAYEAFEILTVLKLPTDDLMMAATTKDIETIRSDALIKYQHSCTTKTFHKYLTPKKLRLLIESLIKGDKEEVKVRIFYGDPYTGEDWCEENDVAGVIRRTNGFLKVPILIASDKDCGGPAILEDSIIKVVEVATGKILWKSSNYITPELIIIQSKNKNDLYDVNRIVADKEINLASFNDYGTAASYVAYITGAIYGYMHSLTSVE